MNWVVGHNMPGYLPESDPWVTDDWESAHDALISEIERRKDSEFDLDEDADVSEFNDALDNLMDAKPGSEWGTIIGKTLYWLLATDEESEADES